MEHPALHCKVIYITMICKGMSRALTTRQMKFVMASCKANRTHEQHAMRVTRTQLPTSPAKRSAGGASNAPGDLSKIARCGAKNRKGTPCQCPAMRNGRCRLHGGLSTGPKTPDGIERIREARTKHGRYSAAAKAEYRRARAQLRALKAWMSGDE